MRRHYRVRVDIHRDEHHELEAVKARLQERFQQVPQPKVESVVDEIYGDLDGPVRDFVPVLVEHLARERLTSQP